MKNACGCSGVVIYHMLLREITSTDTLSIDTKPKASIAKLACGCSDDVHSFEGRQTKHKRTNQISNSK